MKEYIISQLIPQLIPLLIAFIIGILTVIIKAVGDAIITLVQTKKEEVIQKILQGKHEQEVKTALEVWNIVDEHFRVSKAVGDTIQLKIAMFNYLLLKKIPGITQEQIDYLRQTVAGEVNKFKAAIADISTSTTPKPEADPEVKKPILDYHSEE
jgi:hypothetical protein